MPLADLKNIGEHLTLCKETNHPALSLLHTRTLTQALCNLNNNRQTSTVALFDHSLHLHPWQLPHKRASGTGLLHLLEVHPQAPTKSRHQYTTQRHRQPLLNILLSCNTKSHSNLSVCKLCNRNTHPCSRNHNAIA